PPAKSSETRSRNSASERSFSASRSGRHWSKYAPRTSSGSSAERCAESPGGRRSRSECSTAPSTCQAVCRSVPRSSMISSSQIWVVCRVLSKTSKPLALIFHSNIWMTGNAGTLAPVALWQIKLALTRRLSRAHRFSEPDLHGQRAGIPCSFHELQRVAALQCVGLAVHHAVAMKIESRALIGQDESVIALGEQLRYLTLHRGGMRLDRALAHLAEGTQLRFGSLEGVMHGGINVGMGVALLHVMGFAANHQKTARRLHL